MSSTQDSYQPSPSNKSFIFSPPSRQLTYFSTGTLAGLSTVPVSALIARARVPLLAPSFRAGVRFYAFDLTKANLPKSLPVPLVGGFSGAVGGLSEVLAHSIVATRKLPSLATLGSQGGKLFLCFGTYTGLSTNLSKEQPPRPFWWCWTLGAVAGGFGTGVMSIVEEGWKGWARLGRSAGAGATVVGTVIAVQVTSAKEVLDIIGE